MKEFESGIVNVGGDGGALTPLSFDERMSELELEDAFCRNPSLFGEELLLLGRQLAEFAEDSRTLDVLAVDRDGEKVLIEFKVDPAFPFTELQAIAYAGAYANVENEQFPRTLHQSAITKGKEEIRKAAGLSIDASPEEVTEVFLKFLNLNSLEEWDPSKQVRIKVIAPDFPARVLHNIKWLAEVYEMPIEAVKVELFEIEGQLHLKADRLFPLPGAERFELSLRNMETSKRKKNVSRNKPVLPLLVEDGSLEPGDRIWLTSASFPPSVRSEIEALTEPTDEIFSGLVDEENPSKIVWKANEEAEPKLVSPASLPAEVAAHLLGADPKSIPGIGVGESYTDEKSGEKLNAIARDKGLWV